MNSTPATPASIMRLTALTPAPPTPTTRSTGWWTLGFAGILGSSRGRYSRSVAGCERGRSSTSWGMSCAKAALRRSLGLGMGCCSGSGACSATGSTRGSGSGCAGAASVGASSSVRLKSCESGPSRMLARLPPAIRKDLLRKITVGLCRHAVGVVLQDRGALHGRLREPDRLADPGGEDTVAEVLLEDLDRLLGVNGAAIHE